MTGYLLSSHEADVRSTAAAARLRAAGLHRGDRVAVLAPEPGLPADRAAAGQAAVASLAFGALRTGIVPVMVNPLLTAEEQQGYLADARCAAVVATTSDALALTDPHGVPGAPSELADVPLGRPMHFTSGTTGRSKGVWAGVLDEPTAARYWADEHDQWRIEPGDVVLTHGPLAHSAPLRFSFLAFLHGADVVYTGGFDVDRTSAAMRQYRPTVAMAVPTHLQRLLQQPGGPPPSTYRMLVHAGSACPPDLKRAIHTWAGVEHVWEFLGSTEGQFTACRGAEWEERPGTLGRARVGRRLLIDDGARAQPGVIWCAAPDFAAFSYFDDEAKTAAAWTKVDSGTQAGVGTGRTRAFTVGDLGHLDDDGYLFLHGRRTDLIVTGGVNVYPAEVEAELRGCPGVTDAAVYGLPDPQWGERVCAAVVGEATAAQVNAWCREHVAPYRRPKQVTPVPALPLTANGKVLRDGLAAWVAEHG